MPELIARTENSHHSRIQDPELAHLGALMVRSTIRTDLTTVAEAHTKATGVANPNVIGEGLFPGSNHGVPMSEGKAYRQVGVEAIEDLVDVGVVRNGATAQGTEHPRWGHKVFFVTGEEGKTMPTGQRFVIEVDANESDTWLTADKVQGIYTKDTDGVIKNIIP